MKNWLAPTRGYALRMTRFFSQTDRAGEKDFAPFLLDLLSQWPYFQEFPDQLRLERTLNDSLERCVLFGLVRGRGVQTLILTGHYDVVGVENYGDLAEWACEPDELLPRLIARLESEAATARGLQPADRQALDDLRGGDFLPGRGLLDMKSGLAAALAVMERYSQLPLDERPGNLLFVAVPDEEIASNGARTAALLLSGLAREWNLDLVGAINLDASNDHGDGSQGQAAYLGSIGKLLPSVYFVGRETHAGFPFSGVNANRLAAELTRRVDCAPSLADELEGEHTAPPACLKQADTKNHYDVTTPTAAWCYYNWLTLRQPVGAVLQKMMALAREALEAALSDLRQAADEYSRVAPLADPVPAWQARVYSFAEVKALALERGGAAVADSLRALEEKLAGTPELDAPTCCLSLTEAAWAASGLSGPAAVVGFAAIHYAPALTAFVGVQNERAERLNKAIVRQAEGLSREANTPIRVRPFFPAISDVSFFGGQLSALDIQALSANSPAWDKRTGFDYAAVSDLELPAVNIGPWGRDYHQRTERVHTPYTFVVLPELLWRITLDLFQS